LRPRLEKGAWRLGQLLDNIMLALGREGLRRIATRSKPSMGISEASRREHASRRNPKQCEFTSIMERLGCPPNFANQIGVEARVREAAALGNLAQLRVIRGVDPAKQGVNSSKRLLQCDRLLRLDMALLISVAAKPNPAHNRMTPTMVIGRKRASRAR